jgi:hypothetical protein
MLTGCIGFAVVSLIGFSVWAFAGRWLYRKFGDIGLFSGCLAAFLGSAGLLLSQLLYAPNRFGRFYKLFVPAFFAYAFVWCAAWFGFRLGLGEWLGSLLGSIAFVAVLGWRFSHYRGFVKACAVLFLCHSAGYFLGAEFMRSAARMAGTFDLSKSSLALMGMLGWGMIYGAGFGAGIGYVFYNFQVDAERARVASADSNV